MKLPCKVTQDLLPLYYDGMCSEESKALIKDHLKECPQCSKMLSDLSSDILQTNNTVDDLRPLKKLKKKWQRKNIKKGICIALAVFLLIAAVLTGLWYFSYGKYFHQMSRPMKRATEADRFISSAEYTAQIGSMRFDVFMPVVLSNSGFARVMDDYGLVMFLYPKVGGTFSYWIMITDEAGKSWSVHLNEDLTANFVDHPFPVRSDEEKAHITQLLMEQKEHITAMMEAVYVLWGIDLI